MSEELIERVDETLQYGDSRSGWVRDAMELKLEIMEELSEKELDLNDEERREFVVEAVRMAAEE